MVDIGIWSKEIRGVDKQAFWSNSLLCSDESKFKNTDSWPWWEARIFNHWKEFNLTLMFYHTCNKQKLIWVIQISLPTSNIYSKLKINNQWQNVIISRPAPCFLLSFLSAPNPLSLAIGICWFKEKVRSSFSLFSVHTSLFSKTFLFAAFANLLSCSSLSKNHNKR